MVRAQPRIQSIPLILQPRCDFYTDPVLVLDFRSLYPSIVIAYNLCYSTCAGVVQKNACGRLGVTTRYTQNESLLHAYLADDCVSSTDGSTNNASPLLMAPNGAMFVPPSVRSGVLPQMLRAILDTRFELQAALKHIAIPAHDTLFEQRLEKQQQALKMLANVTYGYTGASHTGRMPCVDVAEAIVSLGRQTLQRAIALVHGERAR
uniref:DNA-directed DNA polymerase n=1 Tax=Lygus hesperus TaxID=30085 RepID=A0A0A9XF66_LYGHE